jgi:hypothetical protein
MSPGDEPGGRGKGLMKVEGRPYLTATLWALALVVLIVMAVFNILAAIVVALFLLAFVLKVNPQIPFALTLVILLLCGLLTLIDQKTAANSLANWAYCFFAIGVVLHLYYYIREGSSENGKE